MRPNPFILSTMLVVAVLAGCSEDPLTVPDQSSYRQTTDYSQSTATYGTSQGIYVDPALEVATSSPVATVSATPGSGVTAEVSSSQTTGIFKKTLELAITVQNQDEVEHSGYLVVTFRDAAGQTELAYRYVTIAPHGLQTLKVSSTGPAASGAVVFRERFL